VGREVAAFTAALFAVHPMHVESVAWASERKDTLSTLFIVIALLLYARAPQKKLGVTLAMAASLGAKQMYVTFPFVLLLLDYWPLARLRRLADLEACIVEKLSLFALSIAGSVIAVVGQHNLKAMQTTEGVSMASRLANATVAYCRYLGKLFVPVDLALPYPLVSLPPMEVLGATVLLLAITAGAVALRKRAPYLAVGWFWFVGTLVPVIGLVALGAQSMADRYSYFAYIGLFLAIAAGALTLPIPRQALAAAGVVVVLVCAEIAFHQVGYWRDSETLFTHAIAVTPPNAVAEYSLGQALELMKPDASVAHLRRAIEYTIYAMRDRMESAPEWYTQAYVGIGTALLMKARQEPDGPARVVLIRDAQQQLQTALKIDANAPHAKNNLAFAQIMLAQSAAGTPTHSEYDMVIERGVELMKHNDATGAVAAFRQAIDLQPRSSAAQVCLALALLRARRGHEAADALRAAKALDPAKANEFITKALRMPPGPHNIDILIAQAAGQ
jgi:tetratricopeptide (TPR) repeat protein